VGETVVGENVVTLGPGVPQDGKEKDPMRVWSLRLRSA
jgi:hypothetical protein